MAAHFHLVQRHEIAGLYVAVLSRGLHQENGLLPEAMRHRLHFFSGKMVCVQGHRRGIAAARLFFENNGMNGLMHVSLRKNRIRKKVLP